MEGLLLLVLTNAGSAALLALVAWAASRAVKRPALSHALWLLALVKLVTPPVLPLRLLPELGARHAAPTQAGPIVVPTAPAAADPWSPPAEFAPAAPASVLVSPKPPHRPAVEHPTTPASSAARRPRDGRTAVVGPAPAARRLGWTSLLALVLGLGASVILGLAALRFRRFRRLLEDARPAPPELCASANELASELGLRRVPPLLVVAAPIPPMLWPEPTGPRLLLPRDLLDQLSEPECAALLAHELAHVRRRDHWVRLLELLATALFWWYPVAWWARAALRRAEERCCDEWVLRVLPRSAEAYAQGLLKSLSFVSQASVAVPALASGASPLCELEGRLKEILMSRPAPRLAAPLRVTLAAAAALGLAVYPIQARQDAASPASRSSAATKAAPAGQAAAATPAEPPAAAPVAAPALPRPVGTSAQPAPPADPSSPTEPVRTNRRMTPLAPVAPPAAPADVTAPATAWPAAPAVPAEVTTAPARPARVSLAPPDGLPRTPAPPRATAGVLAPSPPSSGTGFGDSLLAPTPQALIAETALPTRPSAEIQERRRMIESKRRRLRQEALELERQEIELRAQAHEVELHAEAETMRARGEAERAALLDRQAELAGRRAEHERRRLERALELESRMASDERRQAEKLRALEAEAAREGADVLRRQVEHELMKRERAIEDEARGLERKVRELEREAQIHAVTEATDELARALAEHGRQPEIERELARLRAALDALRDGRPPSASSAKPPSAPRAKPKQP